MKASNLLNPMDVVDHLQGHTWKKANQLHLKKIISEFAHEQLIVPVIDVMEDLWGHYTLTADTPGIVYRFRAQILTLNHWYLDETSIQKFENDIPVNLDSLHFISEFKDRLNITSQILPVYMEEITSTIYGSAFMLSKKALTAKELLEADYQTIEHAMTAGHPCFVANNGRIGFDATDYRHYAPEADQPVNLIWLAGHKSRTSYSGTIDVPYSSLLTQELDPETLETFHHLILKKGLQPSDYFFIPVHPWQWFNKLTSIFAPDIAANYLICLGYGKDDYLAQQSIRTFYNLSHPHKFYTKTALSILNMGFMRGLSPYYMDSTPVITEWITDLVTRDPYLQSLGFTMLGEVATVGYRNLYYEAQGKSLSYNKMLAALWRESPGSKLKQGQQLMTMAALLHIDQDGKAFLPELIKASNLSANEWLASYLKVYLTPLLHCFYVHDMVFMPHGENLILVMENHIPVKAIMKDITEEVMLFNPEATVPEKVQRLKINMPEDMKTLSILTDVFDCFFRFISHILVDHGGYQETLFWKNVAACIHDYQHSRPDLSEKFEKYDLFAPAFKCCGLNRLQLKNNQQMLDISDPVKTLQSVMVGELENPIAMYKKKNEWFSLNDQGLFLTEERPVIPLE